MGGANNNNKKNIYEENWQSSPCRGEQRDISGRQLMGGKMDFGLHVTDDVSGL